MDCSIQNWFYDGEHQNSAGYNICLFVIKTEALPAKDKLLNLGKFVCKKLNKVSTGGKAYVQEETML